MGALPASRVVRPAKDESLRLAELPPNIAAKRQIAALHEAAPKGQPPMRSRAGLRVSFRDLTRHVHRKTVTVRCRSRLPAACTRPHLACCAAQFEPSMTTSLPSWPVLRFDAPKGISPFTPTSKWPARAKQHEEDLERRRRKQEARQRVRRAGSAATRGLGADTGGVQPPRLDPAASARSGSPCSSRGQFGRRSGSCDQGDGDSDSGSDSSDSSGAGGSDGDGGERSGNGGGGTGRRTRRRRQEGDAADGGKGRARGQAPPPEEADPDLNVGDVVGGGYCECCRCTYEDLEAHVACASHREFVSRPHHFAALDRILADVAAEATSAAGPLQRATAARAARVSAERAATAASRAYAAMQSQHDGAASAGGGGAGMSPPTTAFARMEMERERTLQARERRVHALLRRFIAADRADLATEQQWAEQLEDVTAGAKAARERVKANTPPSQLCAWRSWLTHRRSLRRKRRQRRRQSFLAARRGEEELVAGTAASIFRLRIASAGESEPREAPSTVPGVVASLRGVIQEEAAALAANEQRWTAALDRAASAADATPPWHGTISSCAGIGVRESANGCASEATGAGWEAGEEWTEEIARQESQRVVARATQGRGPMRALRRLSMDEGGVDEEEEEEQSEEDGAAAAPASAVSPSLAPASPAMASPSRARTARALVPTTPPRRSPRRCRTSPCSPLPPIRAEPATPPKSARAHKRATASAASTTRRAGDGSATGAGMRLGAVASRAATPCADAASRTSPLTRVVDARGRARGPGTAADSLLCLSPSPRSRRGSDDEAPIPLPPRPLRRSQAGAGPGSARGERNPLWLDDTMQEWTHALVWADRATVTRPLTGFGLTVMHFLDTRNTADAVREMREQEAAEEGGSESDRAAAAARGQRQARICLRQGMDRFLMADDSTASRTVWVNLSTLGKAHRRHYAFPSAAEGVQEDGVALSPSRKQCVLALATVSRAAGPPSTFKLQLHVSLSVAVSRAEEAFAADSPHTGLAFAGPDPEMRAWHYPLSSHPATEFLTRCRLRVLSREPGPRQPLFGRLRFPDLMRGAAMATLLAAEDPAATALTAAPLCASPRRQPARRPRGSVKDEDEEEEEGEDGSRAAAGATTASATGVGSPARKRRRAASTAKA